MTEHQENSRISAILEISEGCVRVLWGKVVERGHGMNFKVHGVHKSYQGVMETIRCL